MSEIKEIVSEIKDCTVGLVRDCGVPLLIFGAVFYGVFAEEQHIRKSRIEERMKNPSYLFERCVQELTAPEPSEATYVNGMGEVAVRVRDGKGMSKTYFPLAGKVTLSLGTSTGNIERTSTEQNLSGYDQMMMNGIRGCYAKHFPATTLGAGSQ